MLAAASLGISPWGKSTEFPQALVGKVPGAEPKLPPKAVNLDATEAQSGGSALDMCNRLHNEGAFNDGVQFLQDLMFHNFRDDEIVLLLPEDPYEGVSHSASRQYARILQNWDAVQNGNVKLSYFVVGADDANKTLPIDNATYQGNRNYVWFEMPSDAIMSGLWNLIDNGAKSAMIMHDSLCFDVISSTGYTFPGGFPIGCPNLGDDMREWYDSGTLNERMYFTPWGSEQDELFPEKTASPSMFVDATKDWNARGLGMSVNEFVDAVRAAIPDMSFTIIGGQFNETTSLKFVHYSLEGGEKLPLDQFHQMMRTHWFYATGIESSYELSLSDAAMAGAVLVDVGKASKAAVKGPATISINAKKDLPLLQEAVDTYKEEALEYET